LGSKKPGPTFLGFRGLSPAPGSCNGTSVLCQTLGSAESDPVARVCHHGALNNRENAVRVPAQGSDVGVTFLGQKSPVRHFWVFAACLLPRVRAMGRRCSARRYGRPKVTLWTEYAAMAPNTAVKSRSVYLRRDLTSGSLSWVGGARSDFLGFLRPVPWPGLVQWGLGALQDVWIG
jgi:hypothetical protein